MIVPDEIDAYAEAHTTPPTELLAALAEETKANLRAPQMLTGAVEGRFLELLVYALGAKRVLELGTYSGYSLISMAAGLPEGGHIDTCEFDFVFIDADKDGYIDYYEAVLPRLTPRGLIVADNTLWSGRVVDGEGPLAAFNDHVAADPRSVQVILSVRDGMTLIRRLS